jgi:hypothetical protein
VLREEGERGELLDSSSEKIVESNTRDTLAHSAFSSFTLCSKFALYKKTQQNELKYIYINFHLHTIEDLERLSMEDLIILIRLCKVASFCSLE